VNERTSTYWIGKRCELCGSRADIMIHHRVAQRDGGDDSPENLQALCATCHSQQRQPGHRMTVRWITGIVRFVGLIHQAYGEYQEQRAAGILSCSSCSASIQAGDFIYGERIEMQTCPACLARVEWFRPPDEHTSRGIGHRCTFCNVAARKGHKYYTGIRLRPAICGACLDGRFREVRLADYRIWGEEPPADFTTQPFSPRFIEITLGLLPDGKLPDSPDASADGPGQQTS
jgi:hypothetical protein